MSDVKRDGLLVEREGLYTEFVEDAERLKQKVLTLSNKDLDTYITLLNQTLYQKDPLPL